MSSRRRLTDSGDAMHESGHRGEISTRSGISASPGLTPLTRSSRAIPAKQGAVALNEFMVKPFIHSTPCDPDPRRGLLARSQRHYLAEKKDNGVHCLIVRITKAIRNRRQPRLKNAAH